MPDHTVDEVIAFNEAFRKLVFDTRDKMNTAGSIRTEDICRMQMLVPHAISEEFFRTQFSDIYTKDTLAISIEFSLNRIKAVYHMAQDRFIVTSINFHKCNGENAMLSTLVGYFLSGSSALDVLTEYDACRTSKFLYNLMYAIVSERNTTL